MRYQLRHIQIWTAKISIISEYPAIFLKISSNRGDVVVDRVDIDHFVQQGIDGHAGDGLDPRFLGYVFRWLMTVWMEMLR